MVAGPATLFAVRLARWVGRSPHPGSIDPNYPREPRSAASTTAVCDRESSSESCGSPLFVRAKTVSFDRKRAKTTWRLTQRVRLRRGRYSAYVRGIDRDGNVEQAQRPTNRASFQLR